MSRIARRRPNRSPNTDSGTVSTATVRATTLLSAPSCVSLNAHSALRNGKTAASTCRHMKSDSSSANASAKTSEGKRERVEPGTGGPATSSPTVAEPVLQHRFGRRGGPGTLAPLRRGGAEMAAEPDGECAGRGEPEEMRDLGQRVCVGGQVALRPLGADLLHDRGEALPLLRQVPVQAAGREVEGAADVRQGAPPRGQQDFDHRTDLRGCGGRPRGGQQ